MRYLITEVTSQAEVEAVLTLGAHALGYDFTKPRVSSEVEKIRELIKKLPPFISKVGIFANAQRYEVEELITFLDLDTLIFAGKEDNEYMKRWYGQKIIKETSLKEGLFLIEENIDAVLIESKDAEKCTDRISKPLIIKAYTRDDLAQVWKLAPWAVQVFCRTPLYDDFINGRVQT